MLLLKQQKTKTNYFSSCKKQKKMYKIFFSTAPGFFVFLFRPAGKNRHRFMVGHRKIILYNNMYYNAFLNYKIEAWWFVLVLVHKFVVKKSKENVN